MCRYDKTMLGSQDWLMLRLTGCEERSESFEDIRAQAELGHEEEAGAWRSRRKKKKVKILV